MADNREEFLERVAALADLVTPQRVSRAARGSLGAIKACIDERRREEFAGLLPLWLRADWEEAELSPRGSGSCDLVDALKESGGYPYRAAAERDLTAFFAALRESLAEGNALAMRSLIPEANRELFDYAASCAYDASVREFL